MGFLRRVETGHDANGKAVFLSIGEPPKTVVNGDMAVSEVFSLDGPPTSATDGGDSSDQSFFLEPPPGGVTVRIIRLPATNEWLRVDIEDPDKPGWHTTHTLDVEVILEGEIVLDLDDGEHRLRAGDVVVQRGTAHRWKVVGDQPCSYLAIMLAPESAGEPHPLAPRMGDDGRIRRIVTGAGVDGPAAVVLRTGEVTMTDLWQTGGPLLTVDQGGDPEGPWALEPLGAGVAVRLVELEPGHDPGDAGWHTTDTIDVDLVLEGSVELSLPDLEPVVLDPGDVVVQRATNHKWTPVGDCRFRMATVMFGLRHNG